MRKLKAALLGGAMMLGTLGGAQAEMTRWDTTATGWEIDVNDQGSCSAYRSYQNGVHFMMGWWPEREAMWISFGKNSWAEHVVNDRVYTVDFETDGKRWTGGKFIGVNKHDGTAGLMSKDTITLEFLKALAQANVVRFWENGNMILGLQLDGSYEAILKALECQKAQTPKKVTPPGNNSVNNDGPWSVPVQRQGTGVTLSVRLNDGEKLTFMLDTGATAIGIPQDLADRLGLKAIRWIKVKYGDGSSGQEAVVVLDKVALNGVMLRNVEATVGPKGSPLLLGKNFLDRFGSYQIDNRQSVLILSK